MTTLSAAPESVRFLRVLVAVLLVCGLVGLALTALFGFEEPNDTLLFLSSGLLLVAPVLVLAHLSVTRALTPTQRRIWFYQLTGRRAPWAYGDYLSCDDSSELRPPGLPRTPRIAVGPTSRHRAAHADSKH